MYLKLDDEVIKKIEKITINDYEISGNLVPAENIEIIIKDLIIEIDSLQERKNENLNVAEPDYDEIGKDISLGMYE